MKKLICFILIILVSIIFVSNIALAGDPKATLKGFAEGGKISKTETIKPTDSAGFKKGGTTPAAYIGGILSTIYGFLGIITMIFVVYGGFMWMFAQGNDQKIQEARKIITSAIIGLAILLSAYLITGFAVTVIGS